MWLKIIKNSNVRCSHKGNFSSSYSTNFRGLLALLFKTRPKLTSSFPAHSLRYRAGAGHVTEHKNDMPEKKNLKKNFMASFCEWGSTASRLEPLRWGSLLFTTKFPEIPSTNFIDLARMKDWVDLGATQWF